MKSGILFAAGALLLTFSLTAETALFDFESPDSLKQWKSNQRGGKLEHSTLFPSEGKYALRYTHPKWQGNVPIWPSFDAQPPVTDWSEYDRLAIDVFHNSPCVIKFNARIRTHGSTKDVRLPNTLIPFQAARLVMPFPAAFRQSKREIGEVRQLHLHSENPPEAIDLYIDNITLYKPGEPVPPLPDSFLEKVRDRIDGQLTEHRQKAESILNQVDTSALPDIWRNFLESRREQCRNMLNATAGNPGNMLELLGNWKSRWLLRSSRAIRQFESNRKAFALTGQFGDVTLGFAPSSGQVLPHAAGFDPLAPETVLSAARNERESFQLIVLPAGKWLKSVRIVPSLFRGSAGTLPESAVEVLPVGYVDTKFLPPYGTRHIGFWPDPLLGFLKEVEIKSGDAQAFWVRFAVPEKQGAGNYRGTLDVVIDNQPAFRVPVALQVRDFTLPRTAQLPVIASFGQNPIQATSPDNRKEWSKNPLYPPNAWTRHRDAWVDMLADYYITFDFLYGGGNWSPDFDSLERLKNEGRLGPFNLGYFNLAAENPDRRYGMQPTIDRIRRNYEEAKRRGLLEHAYIYGCDERPQQDFPRVERAASILKEEFPDVMLLTTTYDNSFGATEEIRSIDAFCPLTPAYLPEKVRTARERGKKVWWYICCGPLPPFANTFVESDLLEGRLLMGAMTAKYRPDGFLYYRINNWNNPLPITSGPFTDWNPTSFGEYNGDGSWTCVGPDGTPLATLRLENFRDGLEDYAYVKLLEAKLAKADPTTPWAKEARAALEVPESLVRNLSEYTRDPEELQKWRSRIADAIESAP